MAISTATLTLNLTAIQQLCRGLSGTSILTGVGTPAVSTGSIGDMYFDVTNTTPPLYYNLYGPKTSTWPLTSIQLASTTLTSQITARFTQTPQYSAANIINPGTSPAFTVKQLGSTDVVSFSASGGNAFQITSAGQVGVNISNPQSLSQTAKLVVAGNEFVLGSLTATNFYYNNGTPVFILNKQTAPNFLTIGVSTSGNIITSFNSLLTTLSAIGLFV